MPSAPEGGGGGGGRFFMFIIAGRRAAVVMTVRERWNYIYRTQETANRADRTMSTVGAMARKRVRTTASTMSKLDVVVQAGTGLVRVHALVQPNNARASGAYTHVPHVTGALPNTALPLT
jgi:hypothetical protein